MSWSDFTGATKAAVILAVLSVFVAVTTLNTSSLNGVRSCSFMDFGALGFGAAAAVVGLGVVLKPGTGANPTLNRLIGAAALLVGLWRVAYGLGLVGGPC